jgi:hypothetical protein
MTPRGEDGSCSKERGGLALVLSLFRLVHNWFFTLDGKKPLLFDPSRSDWAVFIEASQVYSGTYYFSGLAQPALDRIGQACCTLSRVDRSLSG